LLIEANEYSLPTLMPIMATELKTSSIQMSGSFSFRGISPPLYPDSGFPSELGAGDGAGYTLNVPVRPGTLGDAYQRSLDDLIGDRIAAFDPTWLLISAGFDAHRRDPLTDLGLSSGDFERLTRRLAEVVKPGRTIAFLEGGYDLLALQGCIGAVVPALLGEDAEAEPETFGSPLPESVGQLRSLLG
jgi:acetoin utilization deacetylase AcuC-like enzyme